MYDLYETETYLKYHSEELMQRAERERGLSQVKRARNQNKSEWTNMSYKFGFIRTPDSRFGQIVIEGELK
jgi:hypothetical protein